MKKQTKGMFPILWVAAAVFCIGLVPRLEADVNGGWVQTNGPYGGEILTIYAAPKAVLFAGTEGAGIFRSTDGGNSWTAVNTGLHYEPGGGFAGVPALGQKGGTLYAGTRRTLYASTDGGNTWHRVSNFQAHESIIGIVVIGDRIYVGASDTGVWYSEDDGDSWLQLKDGFGPMALRELSSIGTTLVAGARGGVFRKRMDEDELLTAINDDFIGHQVGSFAAMEDLLYVGTIGIGAGLLKSNDEGDSWVPITPKEIQHTVEALSVYGATLYAGTYGSGVFRSDDNGDTWTAVNEGLTDRTVSTLLAVNEETVFAGTAEGGIFRTIDGGDAWMEVNTGLTNTRVDVLAVIGKTIYAGVRERLVHSTNGGESWQPAKFPSMPSEYGFSALSVSEGELYTGVIRFGPRDPGGAVGGVFRLDNESNALVQVIANNELTEIQCLEIVGTTFYIGTHRNGIHEWEKDSGPWTTNLGLKGHLITALSVKRGHIYAGTDTGEIYRLTRGEKQWRLINPNMEVGSITGLKWVGSTLYATCLGGVEGVFRSIDGGDAWTSISDGLDRAAVTTIAIDGTDIYVGTVGRGVLRWMEDKQSWKPMDSLPRRVLSLAVLDGFLYAGTLKGGVYKIQIEQ